MSVTIDPPGIPGFPSVPDGIGEITPGWLGAMLQPRFPGADPQALELDIPAFGTATKIPVRVRYNRRAGAPDRMLVKGGFAAHRAAMAYTYAHETRFYREIAGLLSINVPDCFATADDPAIPQHVLLMEDLNARQVRFCRVETPIGFAQARGFLAILARLHATTWDGAVFAPGGALEGLKLWEALPDSHQGGAYAHGQLEPAVWAHYTRLPRFLAVPRPFHDRARMRAGLEALNTLCRTPPFCLLHADFHLGNLYFDADGTPGVLDWQSYSRGRWSHDVTYFLVSALDPPDRRRWEAALIAYYLDRLREGGVQSPPTLDEAMAEYRLQIIDGLFYWLVNPPDWQSEENNCSVAPRFAAAALDHGTWESF